MENKTPVTQIQNLFNDYKDDETVLAKEYNGNISALKEAIEYNGKLLKEEQTKVATLSTGNIPAEGVSTNQIATDAVTEDKLSPDIKYGLLFKETNVAAYFKDFLVQLYKTTPGIRGAFMNGSITDVGHTFRVPTSFESVDVTQTVTASARLANVTNAPWETLTLQNKYAPGEYTLGAYGPGTTYAVRKVTSKWKTNYVLEQPMQLDDGSTLRFAYTASVESTWESEYDISTNHRRAISFKIEAVDINGKTTDITHCFAASYVENESRIQNRIIDAWSWHFIGGFTCANVKNIIVTLTYSYEPHSAGVGYAKYSTQDVIGSKTAKYAHYSSEIYFLAGSSTYANTATDKEYSGFAKTAGDIPRVHLCYKVHGDFPEDYLTTASVKTSVFCSADHIEGVDLYARKGYASALYIDGTADRSSKQELSAVPEEANACFISKTFTAPYCVVFDVVQATNFFNEGLLAPGTYKLTRNPFHASWCIYDVDYEDLLDALKDDNAITNIRKEYFDFGASGVQYKLESSVNDLTLDSICAVRY